jgi:hypothetical protein
VVSPNLEGAKLAKFAKFAKFARFYLCECFMGHRPCLECHGHTPGLPLPDA